MSKCEVKSIILSLNNTNYRGQVEVPTRVLIMSIDIILNILVKLINQTFSKVVFPNLVKLFEIVPVLEN